VRGAAPKDGIRAGSSSPGGLRLVALDLDGVVWKGDQVLAGAREALEDVLARGLDLRYVTNNSTAQRESVSGRLATAGLPAGVERVLTSGVVCSTWLRARLPEGSSVLVVGEEGLVRELREAGLDAYQASGGQGVSTGEPSVVGSASPAAVVIGMDRSFNYETLAAAQAAVGSGALYVATNDDATFPTPGGLRPGAGSIVAAVSTAAQKDPVVVGKPNAAVAETLALITGTPSADTLFVGDRLETDIAMAKAAGMVATLTLTGVTSAEDLRQAEEVGEEALPDHVLGDLSELPALLDSLGA
jgi:4-nitrophenyl phosphatase